MIKKKEEIQKAISLRLEGKSLKEIANLLGVAKSSVSLWVRHIKQPEKFTPDYRAKERQRKAALLMLEREKNRVIRKERILSGAGYWMIYAPVGYKGKIYSTGLIYEHRYVLENKLGRTLQKNEIAHHINENTWDNRPENLEVRLKEEHDSYHVSSRGVEMVKLRCPNCTQIFDKPKNQTHLIKGGEYTTCSKSCRGHLSKEISLRGVSPLIKENILKNVLKIYHQSPHSLVD